MPERHHISSTFDKALNQLRDDVIMMASLTERSLNNAIKGLMERSSDLCARVIADDEEIDQLEKEVDRDGISIILRFQPVASDLRQIISAMKISSNIERVADQAVNISKRARKLNEEPPLAELPLLEPMFRQALSLFKDSMRAFIEGDVALAGALRQRDKQIDALAADVARTITGKIEKAQRGVTGYIDLIFIARHLERVGDHAKNIAEDAIYAASAEDVRHLHKPTE